MWDRHYHEFEDWQLDWLLEKTVGKLSPEKNLHILLKKLDFVLCCDILRQDIILFMLKENK